MEESSPNYERIKQAFREWYKQDEFAIIYREDVGFRAMKCSKRGNDVYVYRVKKSLEGIEDLAQQTYSLKLFEREGDHSNLLFITLTYDTKRCTVKEAWENVGTEFNKFVSALKRRYGEIAFIRAWESFENGYPHVHMIAKFEDHGFTVVKKNEVFRVEEKRELENLWHSFIDIEPVQHLGKGLYYLVKYVSKELHAREREGKHETTLAMMWLFRKRAFSISKHFIEQLGLLVGYRLDFLKHNSNLKMLQTTLEGEIIPALPWTFVGIFPKEFVVRWSDSKPNSWYHVLDKKCERELAEIIKERSLKRF